MANTLLRFSPACANFPLHLPPPPPPPNPLKLPHRSKQRGCPDDAAGAEAVWAGEEGHWLEH